MNHSDLEPASAVSDYPRCEVIRPSTGEACGETAIDGFLCMAHAKLARLQGPNALEALALLFGCGDVPKLIVRARGADRREYRVVLRSDNPVGLSREEGDIALEQFYRQAFEHEVIIIEGPYVHWQPLPFP